MCPQLPRLSPKYSHKAGLQTVITGMPLQIRPITRGGHAGPVTMGRIARGPLSWTRPHCGMPSSPVFVWCRSKRRVSLPALSLSEQRLSSGDFERRVAFLPSLQHTHQNETQPRKAGPLAKKCDKSLQASINTPFEARGLRSGTIIRGTPRLLISAGNPHQHKAAKA
jgi:hypothetical protein